MAPMRGERGGSPAKGARPALPLSRRLIRQIARHVASSGRSLRRLEVSGRVIENFEDIVDDGTDDSDQEMPVTAVACGGNAGNLPPPDHDDELKSLSWLQDKNLLRGINLSKGDVDDNHRIIGSHVVVKTEQPITPPPLTQPISPPRTPQKAPPSPPSPPVLHAKPPYSFSCLIFMAIEAAPSRALPVKEIYAWIIKHFPYFRSAPQGWKNSVRHNLSLNKCFHKVAAAPGLGKGSLWTVDPQHRATLLQNLSQAFGRVPNGAEHEMAPGADEYLAAATVLAMKYGPGVLEQLPPEASLVISRCARDEHSYSGCEERRTAEALLNLAGITPAPS